MNAEFGAKTKPMAADGGTPAAITGGVLRFVGFDVDRKKVESQARDVMRHAGLVAE